MRLGVAPEVSVGTVTGGRPVAANKRKQPEPAGVSEPFRDSAAYALGKRLIDLAVSAISLAAFSPLMALIACAIKIESRGSVLFGHERLGKHGRTFRCLKFRTMREGAQQELLLNPELKRRYVENDYKIPLDDDPRITRVGRFLRKSSLDELPQLFNVLFGSMSLVGPRPIVREELHWYGGSSDEFLSVTPGITGVWQIQGRSRIPYPQRTEVELEGIRMRSFWRDLKVLILSIPAVIIARGSL